MEAEGERAAQHLLGLATHHGSGASGPLQRSQSRERIDGRRRVRFERAAQALTATGALTESDVQPFRRRLEDEIQRAAVPEPVIDDELARRARALLATRLGELAEAAADPAAGAQPGARHAACVAAFGRVHAACACCGALTEAELSRWRARLCEVDDGRTWWLERERREARCTLTDLRAVVCGEPTHTEGVRIASVELYADGLVLRWNAHARLARASTGAGPDGPGSGPVAPVALTDDVGTDYLHVHTGQVMCDVGGPVAGTSTFATMVPRAATQLIAEIGHPRLTVALGAAGKRA